MGIFNRVESFYNSFKKDKGIIGFSYLRKPIYYFEVKKSESPKILIQCAMHAREYVTSLFCLDEIEEFIKKGEFGDAVFIPLVNPDGVRIAEEINPLYKANFRGVDLNVNFDAKFGSGEKNQKVSGSENYIGEFAFSERETRAIRDFTYSFRPDMTVSYHTKGEEIYYRFYQSGKNLKRDYKLAKVASEFTGYKIVDLYNSAGGYKDWCVEKLQIPAITVEAGNDGFSHPLGEKELNDIKEHNLGITNALIKGLRKYGY